MKVLKLRWFNLCLLSGQRHALVNPPQKFYWKKISLQGDPKEYPRSTLVLEIYTLSVSEEFISVS